MKKLFLSFSAVLLAVCVHADAQTVQGAVQYAAQKQELVSIGIEIQTKTDAMHNALDTHKISQALKLGLEVKSLYQKQKEKAERYGFKIVPVMGDVRLKKYQIQAPSLYSEELEEDILLCQVMLGKISLADAIDQNKHLLTQRGVIAFLTGHVPQMNVAFLSINEAFKASKKCGKEITGAFDKGKVQFLPEEYCVQP